MTTNVTFNEMLVARLRALDRNGRSCHHGKLFNLGCGQCCYALGRLELAARLLGVTVEEVKQLWPAKL